jgi:hypothetical protein
VLFGLYVERMEDRPTRRSFNRITSDDLDRLAVMAMRDQERLYVKYPEWRARFIAAALAQGAAEHFVTGTVGVKDFDVWSCFARAPGVRFPFGGQRKLHRDFGESHHGRQAYTEEERTTPNLAAKIRRWEQFSGRRVDLMMRDLGCGANTDPRDALVA